MNAHVSTQATEQQLQAALDSAYRRRTSIGTLWTFIVAHRLSTIRAADRVAVMEHGSLVELGTSIELLSNPDSAFARLHALQR